MELKEITDHNFDAEVLGADSPVLLEFGAAWCPPCRSLLPVLRGIADEHAGRLLVATVDIDRNPGLVERFMVRSAPTLLVFKQGQVVAARVGAAPKEKLLEMVG